MKLKHIAPISLVGLTLVLAALIFSLPTENVTADAAANENTLIKNVRLVQPSGALGDSVSLLLRDGLIHRITPVEDASDLPEARIIDGRGLTVLPGLIDSHTHSYGSALTDAARFGVTAVLDMFTDPRGLADTRRARDDLTQTIRADLYSAGMLATAAGGHGSQFGVPIETLSQPDAAAAWVAARQAEGSDYIKLVYIPGNDNLPSLDEATARAVIDAAHAAGLLALAHISTFAAAEVMVDAGIDGLVHIFADREISDALTAKLKANGVFVIPTLAVIAGIDGDEGAATLAARNAEFLSPAQKQSVAVSFSVPTEDFSLDIALRNTTRLFAAGVPILAGADAPNPGTAHGLSLHLSLIHI